MRTLVMGLILSASLVATAAPDAKKAKEVGNTTIDKMTSPKSMNLTVNPLGMMFGAANAQLEFAMGDHWSLGGKLAYAKYTSGSSSATSMGAGVMGGYYGNGVFRDGFLGTLSADFVSASGTGGTSASGFGLVAIAGYGWFWDGGFNMNVGGGLQYISLDFGKLGLGSVSGTIPALAFNLGYAF